MARQHWVSAISLHYCCSQLRNTANGEGTTFTFCLHIYRHIVYISSCKLSPLTQRSGWPIRMIYTVLSAVLLHPYRHCKRSSYLYDIQAVRVAESGLLSLLIQLFSGRRRSSSCTHIPHWEGNSMGGPSFIYGTNASFYDHFGLRSVFMDGKDWFIFCVMYSKPSCMINVYGWWSVLYDRPS